MLAVQDRPSGKLPAVAVRAPKRRRMNTDTACAAVAKLRKGISWHRQWAFYIILPNTYFFADQLRGHGAKCETLGCGH